jgi:hypothetical protein
MITLLQNRSWGGRQFQFGGSIHPKQTPAGEIALLYPALRYAKRGSVRLHKYGEGPFCSFRVALPRASGVYVICEGSAAKYVGQTVHLAARFYQYGQISPKNCYTGGRSTNCRMNRLILGSLRSGRRIDVYYSLTSEFFALEQALILEMRPAWNVRLLAAVSSR